MAAASTPASAAMRPTDGATFSVALATGAAGAAEAAGLAEAAVAQVEIKILIEAEEAEQKEL